MAPLAKEGVDSIQFQTSRTKRDVSRIILIALIPESHPQLRIRASKETTSRVQGRQMTDEELNLLQLNIEADHYALGWIGENVEPGEVFATELYQLNFKPQ